MIGLLAGVQRSWSRRCASQAAIAFFFALRARRAANSPSNPPETPLSVPSPCIWLDMAALAIWSTPLLSPTGFLSPGIRFRLGVTDLPLPCVCDVHTVAPGLVECLAFTLRGSRQIRALICLWVVAGRTTTCRRRTRPALRRAPLGSNRPASAHLGHEHRSSPDRGDVPYGASFNARSVGERKRPNAATTTSGYRRPEDVSRSGCR